jgi:alpha-tubulin suppressor-like RCC1 family protein
MKLFNKNLIKSTFKGFSTKTQLYIWISNVSPGLRADDYKNKVLLRREPTLADFFNGKNPTSVYMGPRHSGVVTEDGNLYTFGNGNWGVLGHGDETSIKAEMPKKVEFFEKNKIKIKKVCMGDFHTVALTETGDVYTWGFGGRKGFLGIFFVDRGALGHGDINHTFIPKKVKYFSDHNIKIKDIGCGIRHSIALSGNYNLIL